MKNCIITIIAILIGITIYHFFFQKRIAYVESSKVIESFSVAIKARQKFGAEKEEWEKELKMIEDSLNTAMANLKNGYERGSSNDKKQLAINLEKWNRDYTRFSRTIEQKKIMREQELMQPAIDKINKFMEIWGTEHKYDIIFGTMAGGNIVHANRNLDVTMQVIADLNEHSVVSGKD